MGSKKANSGLEWARKKRAHVLRHIDVEKMLAELGLDIIETTSNDYIVHCPHKEHHDDSKASCAVHKERGVYFCHGCGEDGSAFDLWAKVRGVDWTRAVDELLLLVGSMPSEDDDEDDDEEDRKTISAAPKVELPPIDPVLIDSWHENLMVRSPKQKHEILNGWGIDEKTLRRFKLGWDGDRYTIPIMDAAGEYRNVRRYRPNSKTGRKVLNYQQGDAKYGSPTRLFPLENLDGDKVILVEGEKDAIVASQRGFPAVTATSGATYWKEEFNELFKGKTVYICYDQDAAGQQGTEKVAHSLADVCEVLLVKLPETAEIKGFDITNYFVDYGASKEDFEVLLLDAVVYAKPIADVLGEDEEEPVPVPLAAATMARYHGKPISASVVVSGKHTSPYLVPRKLRVQCWCSDPDSACATCPRWHKSKEPTKFYNERIEIRAKDPELLSLINCSEAQQKGLIRNMSGIAKGCNNGKVEVEEYGNMQQIIVIPELDQLNYDMGDSEYVSRNGYYLGHNIQANHSYRVAGYTHPDPRNQLATHVFFHKDEARDDISNFEMTPDLFSELSETFRPEKGESIEDKLTDIYNYLTKHVHFIRGRPELQLAFDLVWHSVLTFDFMNQPVRKGWLEGLVIGDTSQGKTELTSRMRDYYNLGARITGEKTSSAGLVGGLQKMGDQWILQWGAYPQQDRRAMLIDEYSSLSEEDIANMTDLRSTGIAEIVKVRTERTRARVRTLACSNSRPGRMLKTYMHSITAIQELMGKAEDTRRLDFALSVATGEVDIMSMNRPVSAIPNSKKEYPADLCRQLVLFAWSRNLHPATGQVVFTKAAEGAILIAAKEFGEKYHPKIPLVEPSDQRLKLARMATSLAARLFSTDAIGEAIVVDEEHVNYVVAWLQAQYDKPSMGYDAWSEEQWRGDRFEKDVPELITKHILQMPHGFEAVMFLATQSRAFRINDMMASCNMMREEAGEIMQVLVRHAAVANTSGGFRPNPNLNELLRSLRNGEEIGGLKLEDFNPEKRKASPFATGTVPTP